MRQSKAALALIGVLIAAQCAPVFARGHSGGSRSHRSHASSGARAPVRPAPLLAAPAHAAPVHPAPVRAAPSRYFFPITRAAVFASVPLYEPLFDPGPGYYYSPPPEAYSPPPGSSPVVYIEQATEPAYWYFCPQLNTYYPYVLECPEAWQQVLPQTPE